jgi:hypothetical protein
VCFWVGRVSNVACETLLHRGLVCDCTTNRYWCTPKLLNFVQPMLEGESVNVPVEGAPSAPQKRNNTKRRQQSNKKPGKAAAAPVVEREREDFETIVVEPVDPCFQPDDVAFHESQSALKKQLSEARLRSQEIDTALAQLQIKRNAALEVLKPTAQLLRNVKANKQEIYGHLEMNKNKQDKVLEAIATEKESLRQMKRNLQFKSEDAIDAVVDELERSMSQSGLSLREEKSIISKIRVIKGKKAELKAVAEKEQAFANRPDGIAPLKAEKEKLYQQLTEFKNQEKGLYSQVESLRGELDTLNKEMQALKEEKSALYELRKNAKAELEQLKEDHDWAVQQFWMYQRWLKYQRYIANKKAKEEQEAYRKQKEAEREAEEAKLDPYQEQKDLCAAMESYLQRFIVEGRSNVREEGEREEPVVIPDIDDDDWGFGGFVQSQKKKSKKNRRQRRSVEIVGITHSPDVFGDFAKLGIEVPMSVADVPEALKKVQELKKFYDNAPHPKKLKEVEESKKRAMQNLKDRRTSSARTLRLFEQERVRRLEEQKEQEQAELVQLLEERANLIATAIALAEAERQARIQDELMRVVEAELVRRLNQRMALDLMKREQMERIAAIQELSMLEELSRRQRAQLVAELLGQEECRIDEDEQDRTELIAEVIAAAEDERRRRVLEWEVEQECREQLIANVIAAAEEERRRRIAESQLVDEIDRAERIAAVIASAEEERERRIATALENLEHGEPVLVAFLRDNAPVINSHL